MSCSALAPLVDQLRDDVESDLRLLDPRHSLTEAATTWRRHCGSAPPPPPAASQACWPILSGWRWFVPCPSQESLLFVDVDESSATATSRELGSDLAYRGILPRCLGRVLCELSEPDFARMEEGDCEPTPLLGTPRRQSSPSYGPWKPVQSLSSMLLLDCASALLLVFALSERLISLNSRLGPCWLSPHFHSSQPPRLRPSLTWALLPQKHGAQTQ